MKNNRQTPSPRREAFTLLEIMVVLFILVTVMGLGIVALQGRLNLANKRTAFTYVKTLENALKGYEVDMGRAPTTEQGLAALVTVPADVHNPGSWGGPYIDNTATFRDPWGMMYQYASPGRNGKSFDVWSYGPDGIDGTNDEIGSWMGSLD
ncbi:MAG: type II secretion system major pseudopilin GspG [Planctomycetaceae bacterium]|jgi:general secretion pathway protein G|nr:type II secretion system major pseudopilin GspG [Planctomycetaceae bacterium]